MQERENELIFPYQEELSGVLGRALRPRVPLQLKTGNGTWTTISVYVDSGADITLLPRSAADILGLRLKSGNEVIMAGLSGELVRSYIHQVEAKVGNLPSFTMKVGIAEKESQVPVLGREGFFDRFRVTFDPSSKSTKLSPLV
ncbi:MAG: aspartyl protease family protein [Thermoprotei archaeon]|nr:aspartyl protease family protein [TACK group archaeon]